MAGQESLGRAILTLEVDDTALRNGVRNARQFVEQQLGRSTGGRGTSQGRRGDPQDRRTATMVITRNLGERLNQLEERGVNVARIRRTLDRAALATDRNRIETARTLNRLAREFITTNERGLRSAKRLQQASAPQGRVGRQLGNQLSFDLRKERDRLRLQQQQRTESERQLRRSQQIGGARSPLRGTTSIPGSPAALAASARIGGARSSIRGSVDIPGSPAYVEAYQRELDKAAKAGGARSPLRGAKNIPGSPAFLEEQARQYKAAVAKAARAGGARTFIRGSQASKQGQDRLGRINSALVGGAFPLLFGQGPAAAAGGFLGGAIGGGKLGFGLSLIGTILGTAFDAALQKAQALATGLESPIQNFEKLAEAGFISSTGLEKQVRALIETGRTAEAAALLQQDLANLDFDADALQRLREETKNLNNQWNNLSLVLASVAAGPLTDIVAGFNKLLTGRTGDDFSNLDQEIAQVVASERKLITAERQTGQRNALDLQIQGASFKENKLVTLELQKQKQELERLNELSAFNADNVADKIKLENINLKYKKEELRLEQELQREIERRAGLRAQIVDERGAFGRTDAASAATQVNQNLRDTLAQFGPASLEFQLALEQGATRLLESTQQAAERFRDAARGLRDLRLSNLRFLPGAQRRDLLGQERAQGLPEARRRGVALRGIDDLLSFNRFVEQETTARQTVVDAERNLVQANQTLNSSVIEQTGALSSLTQVMGALVNKDWSVYVQVPGQNTAGALDLQTQLN